jgi:hypothetical protein
MKKDSVAILNSLSRLTKERRIRGSRAFRNSITCSAKAISPGPTNRAERPARIQGRKMILAAVVDPASMLANAPAPSDGGRPRTGAAVRTGAPPAAGVSIS